MAAPALLGREPELRLLDELVDRVGERGAALVARGDAGIGKSALLAAASRRARDRGMLVLSTAGVQSEAHLPFAGLHQLLRPVLNGVNELPAPQRAALLAAFGMTEAAAPEFFLIALAALDLLGEAAARSPLLLVVDDAHWLDRPTSDVLAFVARRIEPEPIALLIAIRDGYESGLAEVGLPELHLEGLDRPAAGALLDAHAHELAPAARQRVLEEAAGNPLALVELPVALRSDHLGDGSLLPARLPLTERLERAFATRASELPAATCALLLVAAADDGGVLGEILSAAAIVDGAERTVEVVAPAVFAGLVEVDDQALRFRHPLVRSAIYQSASITSRHAAHAALAAVLEAQPDRRAWHRAASIVGTDDEVASELEEAALRACRRGAVGAAVAAQERAAKLTGDPAHRARRLLRAAQLAFELGRRDLVDRLLREAEPLELGPLEPGRVLWIREMVDPRILGDGGRVRSLVETADRASLEGDSELALDLLWLAGQRSFWADPGEEARRSVVEGAERLGGADGDLRLLAAVGYAAPIERGGVVIDRLSRVEPDARGDPQAMRLLGSAAVTVGAFDLAAGFLAASAARLREQGRLGHLARVLVLQAWSATQLADWNVARPAAEEAGRLAAETGEPLWSAGAQAIGAMLAALRGETDLAETLAADAERIVMPMGVNFMLATVQLARGLTSLGGGRHGEAYERLHRVFDPGDPAYHPFIRCWAIADLVEAAVHSGHEDAARALLEEVALLVEQTPSPWIHAGIDYARPLLADDDDAEALFDAALAAETTRWPFYRARLQLAYGAWLRRRRRAADSRVPLRSARDAFDALGVIQWGERARQELRASGETSGRRTPGAWDRLTPQELHIARMAADGLSNREIGQQLYLSHRTVGYHLYRIFPKLGITSRAELPAILSAASDSSAPVVTPVM
jgi:DNA-binding CsgD family transcriptional regulator